MRLVEQRQTEHRESACAPSRQVQFPREVLEGKVLTVGVHQSEFVHERSEAVAVVHDIAGIAFLRERTFQCQFLEGRTQLQDILVLGVVTGSHLHVEHAAQGVRVVGVERRGKKVAVADDVRVQSTNQTETCVPHVVVVVGRKHLHTLYAVLHTLWGVAVDGQAAAVSFARHTGEGHHQSGRVVGTAGKSRGLLHREHHTARQHGGVHRRLLVHARLHHHLCQFGVVLTQFDVYHHLLGTGNQNLLHHARLVTDVVGLDGIATALTDVDAVIAVHIGHGSHILQLYDLHRRTNQRLAGDSVLHYSSQGLSLHVHCAADGKDGGEHP